LWQDSGKYKKSGITGKIGLSENQPQVRHLHGSALTWMSIQINEILIKEIVAKA
jgi:hypothetical protein